MVIFPPEEVVDESEEAAVRSWFPDGKAMALWLELHADWGCSPVDIRGENTNCILKYTHFYNGMYSGTMISRRQSTRPQTKKTKSRQEDQPTRRN